MSKIGCVAIVKNEERHIAEWLAWQFLVGFDCVFLFNNESTDQTKAIAEGFAPRYDVRVLDWPTQEGGTQERAYMRAVELLRDEFEWLAFFDADEFLVLDEGLNLKAILRQRQEAAIGIQWALFGSSGHLEYPKELVVEAFTRRAPASFAPNAHIKSIVRPRAVKRAFNPHAFEIEGECVDFKGRPLAFQLPGVLAEGRDYDGVKLHHYFTRSWAHWQARAERGTFGAKRTEQEFRDYDRNEVLDDAAARHAPEIKRMLEAFQGGWVAPSKTVAVVLVVKDEASDILAWLAWYRLLGFDAAIVYDDDSTDGTWELVQEAAQHWDIRLSRTIGDRNICYQERQQASYCQALSTYKNEFAWLAFFDADEFLQLRQDKSVGAFLARFPNANEVAVNWCNYGSSGHMLKPKAPPPLAYTWHGGARMEVNKHVKCFVRPGKVGLIG
ncbi:glycosyltransferase family 2 protein [Acidocella aromatica]|uniref:glycosyltransferase family 2 protein n=1 Tax=Acidocella aromatica TaxID=1303579 RepID=UPI001C8647E5